MSQHARDLLEIALRVSAAPWVEEKQWRGDERDGEMTSKQSNFRVFSAVKWWEEHKISSQVAEKIYSIIKKYNN